MRPIDFPEANAKLLAGDIPDCVDLDVFKDGTQIVSKWRMTWRERISALIYGVAFVRVMSPRTSPPVTIQITKQVFIDEGAPKTWRSTLGWNRGRA